MGKFPKKSYNNNRFTICLFQNVHLSLRFFTLFITNES